MNIFEQYGIKEVADVTLYAIELDENDEEIYIPVLYLDTLKISSVEQTAEQTSARGGLGNPHLITWDYGKEITINLEDALYTPASMSMLWGGKYASKSVELWGVFDAHKEKFSWAKAILKDFSNFSIEESQIKGTIYKWTVNLIIMSLDGQLRHEKNNVEISYYSKYGRNYWSFNKPVDFEDGSFTLSEGKNLFVNVPQELIYQIKHGIEGVKFLDRMEKCVATRNFVIDTDTNIKHGNYRYLKKYDKTALTAFIDQTTMQPYEPNLDFFIRKDGSRYPEGGFKKLRLIKQNEVYYKWTRSVAPPHMSLGNRIIVDAEHFPGIYRLVGETYSRNRDTHEDERFQFEIPLCKMGAENSFTLEAAGDPTVFKMTLQVLRKEDGTMMKLTQYNVEQAKYGGQTSGSTTVIPVDDPDITLDDVKIEAKWYSPYELNWGIEEYGDRQDIVGLKIIHPLNLAEFYVDNNMYWATTAEVEDGSIENGEILVEGVAGIARTYLLVQTVDDVIQWENGVPVFVLDEHGNIQTKKEELERLNIKFTSDNEYGQNIEVSLEDSSSEGEG
jgi:hypothetical protein